MKKQKICLVCCPGGHLQELVSVLPFIKNYERYFVTMKRIDIKDFLKNEKVYFVRDTNRNFFNTLHNFWQSAKIFMKHKPNIVITTGAGPAISTCLLAKLFHKRLLFLESFTRVNEPSLFGKLVYPIADTTLVQWKSLLKYYKRARYVGPVFSPCNTLKKYTKQKMIFITVGTSCFGFERLLKKIDSILENKTLKYAVIAQIGSSKYIPRNYRYIKWLNHNQIMQYLSDSEIVITHGGVGSIIGALTCKAKVIAVPRQKKFKEIIDDHQLELTKELEKKGLVSAVYSIEELDIVLKKVMRSKYKSIKFTSKLQKEITLFLGEAL